MVSVPNKAKDGFRYYDSWSGNERGNRENVTRCIAEVTDSTGYHFPQCRRKRGYGPGGLFCKQHAKKADPNFEGVL